MANQDENIQKMRELIKDIRTCMLSTTNEAGRTHSRPMYTQQVEFDGDLWFFTYADSNKTREVGQHSEVNVSFSDDNEWVSASGPANVMRDRAKIDELWREDLKAFFAKGKDDPNLTLLKVTVEEAEYWDSPSNAVVRLYGFAKAKLTGKPYQDEMIDHKKVSL